MICFIFLIFTWWKQQQQKKNASLYFFALWLHLWGKKTTGVLFSKAALKLENKQLWIEPMSKINKEQYQFIFLSHV